MSSEPSEGGLEETRQFKALSPGTVISHYKIVEKIGAGGMGVVYRAEDTKLHRSVALKFLPPDLVCDAEARDRFEHEAEAASALSHPNITTIHEIDEVAGRCFISMEYVEGKSLKEMVREKALSIEDVLAIALQIGEGLKAAHARGVVHRDIKSDNIKVTSDGLVKIMDFGLAKLRGVAKLTRTGTTLGTLHYMSPEQAQGREVDERSDIFSFGVVLYEMVTGRLPFSGDTEVALVHAVVNETPEPMARYKAKVPEGLDRAVEKALAKSRDERYQHVDEMIADLKSTRRKLETAAGLELPDQEKSIVVLPFENLSPDPDQEYFSDGLTEEVISDLSNVRVLRVISRSSAMTFKGTKTTIPEIARRLKVQYVLEGSVRKAGNSLRITAQLIDARSDAHIWAEKYSGTLDDVFDIQEKVSRAIVEALKLKLTPEEKPRLSVNPEAHEAYLKGRFYWNKRTGSDLQKAVNYFNQVIEKDPMYALAYAGLASAYAVLASYAPMPQMEAMSKAEAAANRALELDAKLAEAHAVLGSIRSEFEWDWAGGEREFKRAIELDPSNPTARHWYTLLLLQLGRLDEALAEIKRANELDPLSLVINTVMGDALYFRREYDEAIVQHKKTLELDPCFAVAHLHLGVVYEAQGKSDEAIAEFQKGRALIGSGPYGLSSLGYGYARAGERSEAAKIVNELLEFPGQGYSVSLDIAQIYFGLDDKDKAFEWLEKAYQERPQLLPYLKTQPLWDGLRSDPRFTALLKKMGLAD